jgi:hypothetical protein
MNTLLDNSLVGGAILISAVYAVARLGPRTLRARMLIALSRRLAAAPSFLKLSRVSKGLAAAAQAQSACGGCDNCGTETKPAAQKSSEPSASSQTQASQEIKVPITNIGRRA